MDISSEDVERLIKAEELLLSENETVKDLVSQAVMVQAITASDKNNLTLGLLYQLLAAIDRVDNKIYALREELHRTRVDIEEIKNATGYTRSPMPSYRHNYDYLHSIKDRLAPDREKY
jgi:hypothetical protein